MGHSIAMFCKGYISAYTRAGVYHVCEKSGAWMFGYWLGKKLAEQPEGGE